jgi:hypothetical protein
MKKWWEILIEVIVLLPLKIIELLLNIFAFIIWTLASPFIKIVQIIKGDKTDKNDDYK